MFTSDLLVRTNGFTSLCPTELSSWSLPVLWIDYGHETYARVNYVQPRYKSMPQFSGSGGSPQARVKHGSSTGEKHRSSTGEKHR